MRLNIFYQIPEKDQKEILSEVLESDLENINNLIFDLLKKNDLPLLVKERFGGFGFNDFKDKEINLYFVKDEEIKNLNNDFRQKDKTTDCLSFPYEIEKINPIFGEVFIALPYIKNQAKEYGVVLGFEIKKMLVHSLLHLYGFDHLTDDQFNEMSFFEEKILKLC